MALFRVIFVGGFYTHMDDDWRNKSLFLLGPHVRAKTQLPKVMRQIDPNFSYEFS